MLVLTLLIVVIVLSIALVLSIRAEHQRQDKEAIDHRVALIEQLHPQALAAKYSKDPATGTTVILFLIVSAMIINNYLLPRATSLASNALGRSTGNLTAVAPVCVLTPPDTTCGSILTWSVKKGPVQIKAFIPSKPSNVIFVKKFDAASGSFKADIVGSEGATFELYNAGQKVDEVTITTTVSD